MPFKLDKCELYVFSNERDFTSELNDILKSSNSIVILTGTGLTRKVHFAADRNVILTNMSIELSSEQQNLLSKQIGYVNTTPSTKYKIFLIKEACAQKAGLLPYTYSELGLYGLKYTRDYGPMVLSYFSGAGGAGITSMALSTLPPMALTFLVGCLASRYLAPIVSDTINDCLQAENTEFRSFVRTCSKIFIGDKANSMAKKPANMLCSTILPSGSSTSIVEPEKLVTTPILQNSLKRKASPSFFESNKLRKTTDKSLSYSSTLSM